ncbi:hypothetical protein [Acinetobacter pittii]|uniref:hypothetical protein n=1 Tax=Acinetobacter pittii TaxID=48296 RepID=UPI001F056BCD|nr:hypothetical protein [Acinetobacter pittii]MCH2053996.1 hypothetical protein [Acinetobacter pittii]
MDKKYESHTEALAAFNNTAPRDKRISRQKYAWIRSIFDAKSGEQCTSCKACYIVCHNLIRNRGCQIALEEVHLVEVVFKTILSVLYRKNKNEDSGAYPGEHPRLLNVDLCELAAIYAITFVENLHVIEARYHPAFMKALNGVCLECILHRRIEGLKTSTCTAIPALEGGLFWEVLRASVFEHIKHDDELSILLNPLDTDLLLTYLVNR